MIPVNFSPLELSQWDFHEIDISTLRIIFVEFSPSKSSRWDFTRLLFHLWNRLGSQFSFSLFGIDYVVGLHPWETGWAISEVFVRRFCSSSIIEANFGLGVPTSAYYEAQSAHAISFFLWAKEAELRNSSRQGFLIANWRT
jgi:hypothetical protein